MVLETKLDCIPEVHPERMILDLSKSGFFGWKPYSLFINRYGKGIENDEDSIIDDDLFWNDLKQAFTGDLSHNTKTYLTSSERKILSNIVKYKMHCAREIWKTERNIIKRVGYDYLFSEGLGPIYSLFPDNQRTNLDEDNWANREISRIFDSAMNGDQDSLVKAHRLQKEREKIWLNKIGRTNNNVLLIAGENHLKNSYGVLVNNLKDRGYLLNPIISLSNRKMLDVVNKELLNLQKISAIRHNTDKLSRR